MEPGGSPPHPLDTRIPPVVVFGVVFGLQWMLGRWGATSLPNHPVLVTASRTVVLAAALLGVGAVVQFARRGTSVDPHTPGKVSQLVTGGIYRVTRNPMYLALLLMLVGRALRDGDPLQLAVAGLFAGYMNRFQIRPEERALEAKFGSEYHAFRRRTRRWL